MKKSNQSQFAQIFFRLRRNKAAMLGLVIFLVGVLIAVFAPLIMTHDYAAMDVAARLQGPSAEHFFGTDELGRDLFSRVIYGSRYSLAIGVCAILLAAVIGVILGVIAGYFGGWVDNLIMRFLDVIQSIPALLLVIVIAAVLGTGFAMTVLALSVSYIPAIARLLRASILEVREQEYIEAAHSINCSKLQIIIQHILPNSFAPVIVNLTMGVAGCITASATLSFIGLGVRPPEPEWGALLTGGREFMRTCPYMVIFPGIAIMITVLALNLFGDGLRDAMDPKLRD
jgi:peptide/nickel transport system permease protein